MDKQFAPEYARNDQGWIKLSECEKAYLAGIVDGEGSIGIYQRVRGYLLLFTISNTSNALMTWILCHLGGKARPHKVYEARCKQVFDWQVSGNNAKRVISIIEPHLIVKKEHARIALSFPIGNQSHIFTATENTLRQESCERMAQLNAKGVR